MVPSVVICMLNPGVTMYLFWSPRGTIGSESRDLYAQSKCNYVFIAINIFSVICMRCGVYALWKKSMPARLECGFVCAAECMRCGKNPCQRGALLECDTIEVQ